MILNALVFRPKAVTFHLFDFAWSDKLKTEPVEQLPMRCYVRGNIKNKKVELTLSTVQAVC